MTGMQVPEWLAEAKDEWNKASSGSMPFRVKEMTPITHFSTLFAEYFVEGDDFVLHLFPRNGVGDRWKEGRYVDQCRSCRARVPMPQNIRKLEPCPQCGHCGLVYIPGRKEEKATVVFPGDMRDLILKASDKTWMGEVAIDLVPELGAYAVQFQRAKTTTGLVGHEKFADGFCSELDSLLEGVGHEC